MSNKANNGIWAGSISGFCGVISCVIYYLSCYLLYGILCPGSLLDRVVQSSHSPISIVFKRPVKVHDTHEDGHIDSLRMLLHHENFVKPYSEEHLMVHLLTTPM